MGSIQERISEMKKQRTAAEGGRRAKSADKRSAQLMAKRENKRKGAKANKKDKKAANLKGSGSEGENQCWSIRNHTTLVGLLSNWRASLVLCLSEQFWRLHL